jgi:hypothetical protein
MVQEYIARYGGTASDINADVAEAYSAGQVMADAVESVGLNQKRIIGFLHGLRQPLNTVQGPAQWTSQASGVNTKSVSFVFQWLPGGHFVQVLSSAGKPSKNIIVQKNNWVSG